MKLQAGWSLFFKRNHGFKVNREKSQCAKNGRQTTGSEGTAVVHLLLAFETTKNLAAFKCADSLTIEYTQIIKARCGIFMLNIKEI